MHYVHEFSEHSMIPGFSGYTIALLLIPQGVANNWKNFEQPLSNGDAILAQQGTDLVSADRVGIARLGFKEQPTLRAL